MKERSYLTRRFNFNPETIYSVESETDTTVVVAIKPNFSTIDGINYVLWFDTNRDRMIKIERVLEDTDLQFAFRSDDDQQYSFKPLTADYFKTKIWPSLITIPNQALNDLDAIYQFLNASLLEE
jgi:hypothetical protein